MNAEITPFESAESAAEREALARIQEALRQIGDDDAPPPGWEEPVLAAGRRPPIRRWVYFAPVAVAAAAAAFLIIPRGPDRVEALTLSVTVEPGGGVRRGVVANVGDVVIATVRGGRHRTLWLYRDDSQLVIACPGGPVAELVAMRGGEPSGPACVESEGQLTARIRLRSIGAYTIIGLSSDQPIGPPRGSLDVDVTAARRAGATFELQPLEIH